MYFSRTSKNCLFCRKICEPPPRKNANLTSDSQRKAEEEHQSPSLGEGEGEGGIEVGNCGCYDNPTRFLGSLPFELEDRKILHDSLKYIFVLRKLLEIPRGKCVKYLRRRCVDSGNVEGTDAAFQDGWFSVCEKCSKLVEEGHSIYHEIETLEERLRNLKSNLKENIVSALEKSDAGENREKSNDHEVKEGEISTIYTEIRDHFVPSSTDEVPYPDQSIVKREVGTPTPEDGVDEAEDMNDGDNAAGFHGSEEEEDSDWAPSDLEGMDLGGGDDDDMHGEVDVKPDISKLRLNEKRDGKMDDSKTEASEGKALRRSRRKRKRDEESENDDEAQSKTSEDRELAVLSDPESPSGSSEVNEDSEEEKTPRKGKPGRKRKINLDNLKVTENGDFSCSVCAVLYKTAHRLKEHEDLHLRDDVLKCTQCNFVCLLERGMKIHVARYHTGKTIVAARSSSSREKIRTDDDNDSEDEDSGPRHRCYICKAAYKNLPRLKEHRKLHKNPDALKCSQCPFVCLTPKHLKTHVGKAHEIREKLRPKRIRRDEKGPFHCEKCPAVYQTGHRFREHIVLHDGTSSFACDECGWVFPDEGRLNYHIKLRHTEKTPRKYHKRERPGPIQCEHCPNIYKDRHRFKDHMQTFHRDKLLQCDSCKAYYENNDFLQIHKQRCKGPPPERNRNNEKGDSEEGPSPKKESADSRREFACPYCDNNVAFTSETKLRYHLSRAHGKIHNVCQECGYKAHGAANLRLHMQKHTKEKMYMCEICSRTFVSPTYLSAHKQKEHYKELGLEPIKCDRCEMLLPTKSILKYHIKKVHENDFKYFCDVCGKGFLFASTLRNHAAIHSNERSEICQYCGASYVHNRVLMSHLKSHHPEKYAAMKGLDLKTLPKANVGEGHFKCKFCDMEFNMRWHLLAHLRTHTEVYEKFKCNICGRGYSSQAGVKRHEETEHVSTTFSCEFCGRTFPCRDYLRYHVKNHCKKKNAPSSTVTSENSRDSNPPPPDADPHVVNKAGQLHIVTPSTSGSVQAPNASLPQQAGVFGLGNQASGRGLSLGGDGLDEMGCKRDPAFNY